MHIPPEAIAMQKAMGQSHWPEAIAIGERLLKQGEHDWRIKLNLAIAYIRSRRGPLEYPQALANQALQQSGRHPLACLGNAEILTHAGMWEESIQLLNQLPNPKPWLAMQLRSEALARLGDYSAAHALLENWPKGKRFWRWHLAVADVYCQACQWKLAESHLQQVLAERPNQREARVNMALLLLSQQRCEEAWPYYEWRGSNPRLTVSGAPRALPSLDTLGSQEVVLVGEQGIGDQLMVSRYLPHLANRCLKLRLQLAPRLNGLISRHLPASVLIEYPDTPIGDAEVIGSGSLPYLFWEELRAGTSSKGSFLHADPVRMAQWAQKLGQLPTGLRLGIGWLGGTSGAELRERSLNQKDLEIISGWHSIQCIDLQYLPQQLQHLTSITQGVGMHRLGNPGADLEDTVALIACLDGVLTTRQTVAHLAGALGKRGQVLVPARPEWRYWGNDNRWFWYPSIELLHQDKRGSWGPQLDQAEKFWRAASS